MFICSLSYPNPDKNSLDNSFNSSMFSLNASLYSLICFMSWFEYPISLNLDSFFLFNSFNLRYSFIVSVSSLSCKICIFSFFTSILFYIAFTLFNTGVVTDTPTNANAILLLTLFLILKFNLLLGNWLA